MVSNNVRQRFQRFFYSFFGAFVISGILTFLISVTIYYAMETTLPGAYAKFQLPEIIVQPIPKGRTKHRIFTLKQLKKYNGRYDPSRPILLSVRGVVFDVSKKEGKKNPYYGKDGGWNYMTGHDITRCTARRTWDYKLLDNLSMDYLADDELSTLDYEFRENYMKEYTVYGYMDYFYRDNIEQFEPDDDSKIDEEVWVNPATTPEPVTIDPAEAERMAKEAKAAEARVDKDLAERWAKYRREHPNGEDEL